MSYSIEDGIREAEQTQIVFKQIGARFPDARLDQHGRDRGARGYWVSERLKPEECDHIAVGANDVVRVGTLVGGVMVAMPLGMSAQTVAALLFKLKEQSPEQFRALALFAAGAKP